MGAGTSTEQVADKTKEDHVEEQSDQSPEEDQKQPEDQGVEVVDAASDAKLLQKNGKIAILNGTGEEGEKEETEESEPAKDINGQHPDEADVKDVGQQEPSSVFLNEEPDNAEVAPDNAASKDMRQDGVEEASEVNPTTPESEDNGESPEQTNESLSNEVGFKKVFKFVGFKFTVGKGKTEKPDPVQLLTVKKDEVDANGTENIEKQDNVPEENKPEETQETKAGSPESETVEVPVQEVESPQETAEDKPEIEEEPKVEKEQKKSPVSPTNPLVTETSSFKRFFTQGWAGLRKKASFRKSKEEDPQEVEKHINIDQQDKIEVEKSVTEETEASPTEAIIEAQPAQTEVEQPGKEEIKTFIDEEIPDSTIEQPKPEESLAVKLDEPKVTEKEQTECAEHVTKSVLPVAENAENIVEVVENVVAVMNELTEIKPEADISEEKITITFPEVLSTISLQSAEDALQVLKPDTELNDRSADVLATEQSQVAPNAECTELEKSEEAFTTEAELLSSQEKAKLQGSPLRKLFSSSGLRKLSGKKPKSKKDDDAKVEDATPQAPASAESPEAPDPDGGESSPSSPDESGETSPADKIPEDSQQTVEVEGEGAVFDGERKRDGITPWASFKKLVTPKKRPKRPSESDKEDEVEKVKSSTMSSTDSAGYVENQEDVKENNEEQKLEKSTEENKKKVDNSVSWEALICVGSSKKRARKTSDSEEEIPNALEENKITEEDLANAKELEAEGPQISSQEKEQDSSSPDQVNSPTEGDGVSTWQSFKRLVTPRRKSKSKAEDKIEEPTITSSVEQSTSEGEAGKEETWVSLKKLIPGRKKKKSDAKADQGPLNEGGQGILSETVEDDSDEPAVVPLAEFDAAEQEKLEALQSVDTCVLNDVSKELLTISEKSVELVHAVTVTVIEGERAVTSLEERSPSWISATVSETLNKENVSVEEELKEVIKSEVKVEEHVIFSSVSKVVTEARDTIISDVVLTTEALIALEEAIENSCAEETTEMISAVSQLGESLVTTEDATPVPEENENTKSLDEKKKNTDQILQEVAEKAKLSANALIEGSSLLLESSSASGKVEDLEDMLTQDTHKEGETTKDEKITEEDKIEELQISQTSVCVTTFTEKSTILSVVESTSLPEEQTKYDSSAVDQNAREDAFSFDHNQGDISVLTEANAIENVMILGEEQTKEETFAEKQAVECFHVVEKDTGVEIVHVTDEEQADGGSTSLAEKEADFVLVSAEEPIAETTCKAEEQANEPLPVMAVQEGKEDVLSLSTDQLQKNALADEPTCNLVNLASVDNSNNRAFISEIEKTGSDSPVILENSEELIETKTPVVEKTSERAPLSSEKHDIETSTLSQIQVKELVFVSAPVIHSEDAPILSEDQSKDFTSPLVEQQIDESPYVLAEKPADEGKTILDGTENSTIKRAKGEDVQNLALEEGDEGIHILSEKQNDKNILVLTEKLAEELNQFSTEKEVAKTHVLIEEKVEVVSNLTVIQIDDSTLMFADGVPVIAGKFADEGKNILTEEQAENITILSEERAEIHDLAVSQDEESAHSFTEQTVEGTTVLENKPAVDIKPILTEEQVEHVLILPIQKVEVCDLILETGDAFLADKPSDVEELVEHTLVMSEEKTDLTLDQVAGGDTIVAVKLTNDIISVLAENVPKDIRPLLTGEQAENSPILIEEKDEINVLRDETDDGICALAETQVEEVSNILAGKQMEVVAVVSLGQSVESVSDLPEVKTDVSPTLTKVQYSEGALDVGEEHTTVIVSSFPVEGLTHESDFVLAEEQTGDITPGLTDKYQNLVNEQVESPVIAEEQEENKEMAENVCELTEGQIETNMLLTSLDLNKTVESESILIDNVATQEQSLECTASLTGLHTGEDTIDVEKLHPEEGTTIPTDEQNYEESLFSEETTCVLTEEPIVLLPEKNAASALMPQEKESPLTSAEVDADDHVQESQESVESDVIIKKDQESESEQIVSDSKRVPSEEQLLEMIPVLKKEETDEIAPLPLEVQPEKHSHNLQEQETPLCQTSESTNTPDAISNLTESIEPIVTVISKVKEIVIMKTLPPSDTRETETELKNEIDSNEQSDILKSSACVYQGMSSILSTVVEEELKTVGVENADTDIPEVESAEANKASEPVVAAAVEEQVLAESVKPIEDPPETILLSQIAEKVNISSGEYEITPGALKTVELVSQKAAAIVDAAIEAATGCLILDDFSHSKLEEKSATQKVSREDQQSVHTERNAQEKSTVETITIESHITTTVHKIIETAVEKVVNRGKDLLICNTVESHGLEQESSSGEQQTVVFSSSSSREISIETKQDYHPPSDSCVSASSQIVGQDTMEVVCEPVKAADTTTCTEHQGEAAIDDPLIIELETKEIVKEDLVQEQDVSKILEHKIGTELSTGDHEPVQLGCLSGQTSSETVQIIQPEIISSVPAYTVEEEIPTRDDCINVKTQEISQNVES